ncbi:MAG: hypothetical protein KGR23_02030 [Betaproteobacteria bacterium]|nr:hypothetical protein [Betaproteobacteria bacterium]
MTIPIIWVAVVLSMLVHLAVLWFGLARLRDLAKEGPEPGTSSALAVELAPRASRDANTAGAALPPTIASRAAPRAATAPHAAARPPRARPTPSRPTLSKRRRESVIALDEGAGRPLPPAGASEVAPEAPVRPAPGPATMPPPPAEDLSAYIERQRRARGETTTRPVAGGTNAAAESDLERRDRIVAANLGLNRTPTFGHDPRNAGGIFEIKELNYDDAEFWFFGFDKDIDRNARQLIEVRRGDNPDIRTAVVRKMISIIRENVTGDFLWVSQRLGRQVSLSARPGDNAELEDFIMRDIFPGARPP